MVTLIAPVPPLDTHVRVEFPPGLIEVGVAVSVIESADVTETVAVAVAVPPGPVAFAVYVVEAVGETVADPVGASPVPTPLLMSTVVTFVVDHESVADPPGPMDVGVAVRVIVGAAATTVTVTLAVAVPPAPVSVAVKVVVVFTTTVVDPERASTV
jgi:hypothetical protein